MTSTKLVPVNCAECGAAFARYPSQLKGRARVYCSRSCLGKAKQHGETYHCAFCDTPFYRRDGEADGAIQFCSRPCYMEWRAAVRDPKTYLKIGVRHAHRVVAEAVLGRALTAEEVVHHIDENRQHNHPLNLAVFPDQATHARCHFGAMSAEELDRYRLKV